jgi:formyl-CoA transferase
MAGALDGIRVLEIGGGIAAGYCGKLLAELGADVTKAGLVPARPHDPRPDEPLWTFLHGSKTIAPDSASLALGDGDLVISTQGAETLAGLGLAPDQVADAGKVLVSITNFGLREANPEPLLPDFLMSALGGFVLLTGATDKPPVRNGASLPQFQAAIIGAVGGLAALLGAEAGQGGDVVDVSLLESVTFLMEREDIVYTHQHMLWDRTVRHKIVHPFVILPCRDGHVCLAVASPMMFTSLMEIIGHPELAEDQEILLNTIGNADLIDTVLLPWLAERDKWEIARLCQERRIPTTPVLDFTELLEDEHLKARRFFQPLAWTGGTTPAPGPPYQLSATPLQAGRA